MTELQQLRKVLMANLDKIENKSVDDKTVNNLVQVSNQVIKSYNAELRADELQNKSKDSKELIKNKVFTDDMQ